MTTTLIIAGITVALMVLSVLLKPYIYVKKLKIGLYWIICAAGAAAMLISLIRTAGTLQTDIEKATQSVEAEIRHVAMRQKTFI